VSVSVSVSVSVWVCVCVSAAMSLVSLARNRVPHSLHCVCAPLPSPVTAGTVRCRRRGCS
jgi:hypothetical protein